MAYIQKHFLKNEIFINNKKLKYYLSPNLVRNNFKHGFFTKVSSEINISHLSTFFNKNHSNCILNQVHSNTIVFGSQIKKNKRIDGDGMICDTQNQNLWIYTADCMPIFFADKKKRLVAAIHCGRRGLENRIIKNLIKNFDNLGTCTKDLLVAIGPSISKKNYLIDENTFQEFLKKIYSKESASFSKKAGSPCQLDNILRLKKQGLISLDLKKNAHIQLLDENIPNKNIDISRLCTYESNDNFYSWRRSKTYLRQWSFICP